MSSNAGPRRLAVIGYGAVSDEIIRCLDARGERDALAAILVRPQRRAEYERKAAQRSAVVDSVAQLLAAKPDLVIEAAGHGAVAQYGAEILGNGVDLLICSVGALADRKLAGSLVAAAAPDTELWIASGAVAGIDGLLAARTAGLRSVTYTSLKERKAWQGTPAQVLLDQALLDDTANAQRIIFFAGSAREAALQYPQNANVGATIALAGLGLDRTRVRLGADPHVKGPLGIIEAEGDFGRFGFEILAFASPTNPKTSTLTGHSLVAAARAGMCFRALHLLQAGG